MLDKRFIRLLAVIAVLAAASLLPAGAYAGSGSHNTGHASAPSGNSVTSGTNRTMIPAADRSSGKPVGAHPMGFYRCYRACMAGPAGGGMGRFCRAACSR